jgi:hypothetical protein
LSELAANADALLAEIADEADGGNGDDGDGDGDNGDNGDNGGDGGDGNGDDGDDGGGGGDGDGDGEGEADTTESEDPLAEEKDRIKAAKARVVGDIPEKLLARARERGQQVRTDDSATAGLLVAIEDELGKLRESDEGDSGKTAKLWAEFLRNEDAFKEFVLLVATHYQEALALLKSVVDSSELTDAERARINDTDLVNDGEAALVKEKARDDARAAVSAKGTELELAIAKAYVADINADPEDNAQVQSILTQLAGLNTAQQSAEDDYTAEMREDLDRWEASVPDHIWANLVAYDQAIILLTGIKDGDPNGLATSMDSAESSLTDALSQEDEGLRTNDTLDDLIYRLNERLDFHKATRQKRLLGVVRGDN